MFNNSSPTNPMYDEGYVLQVDSKGYCQVRTERNQILSSVIWMIPVGGSTRGGDRVTPHMGDRVFLNYALGYPIIQGFLPRHQGQDQAIPLAIHTGSLSPQAGDYGTSGAIQPDQNQPPDITQGDRIISSIGGSIVGLLRGGSLILRGGRTAEILLSKVRGLVRVFSRNWAHFSDVGSDIMANVQGHVYRYTGYAKTYPNSKIENYNLHIYAGDVVAGEAAKTNFTGFTGTFPTADNVIYKEQITASDHTELSRRTINELGEEEIWTKSGFEFTRVNVKGDEVRISWSDVSTVVIDKYSIHAFHLGGADVVMDYAGIRATYGNGEINMSATGIDSRFGASDVKLTNSTITATIGASILAMGSSSVEITNGGSLLHIDSTLAALVSGQHSVTVTPAGVTIT